MQKGIITNWFTIIGESWLESLRLFLPRNLKLFLLATLNAVRQSFTIIVFFMLALVPIISFAFILMRFVATDIFGSLLNAAILFSITICLSSIWTWGLVLAIRPSVNKKNVKYFLNRLVYLPYFFIFQIFLFAVYLLIFYLYEVNLMIVTDSYRKSHLINIACFIFGLFLIDQKASIKNMFFAIQRTIKMIFFNIFFFILTFIIYAVLINIGNYLFFNTISLFNYGIWVSAIFFSIIGCFIYLFFYSLLSVFYTKRAHEQFDLYF
jgi:hypothetical protein